MNKFKHINYSFYLGVLFVTVILFICFFGPILAPHSLNVMMETEYRDGKVLAPPLEPFENEAYPFGTDRWGYDLLSMIFYGIRYTVFIALAVTFIKMLAGTLIGLYAGTMKKPPSIISAFEKAWSYIPLFLILYFFLMPISINSSLESSTLVVYFIIVASIVSIPSISSSIRLKTIEVHKSMYIEAAKTLGAKRNRLIWKHIFPQLKESLLVMFVLEIVYVITIMGQLALMNIFVGGTIMRFDPTIYLSATKELAGLVGQAQGNIYGNTHILYVPLAVLLFTTISFSLLANGLKNKFQSDYQRTPWIKTGLNPRIRPIRKQYAHKYLKDMTPNKIGFSILVILFAGAGGYVYATKDANVGVKQDSESNYELQLEMNENGEFTASADIEVMNKSDNDWDKLVFYFIPNVFKKGHSYSTVEGYSELEIRGISLNGEEVDYRLENDELSLSLPDDQKDNEKHKVTVDYSFTVPENGNRFSKVGDDYYLAQWYPMAALYQNGRWNKEPYSDELETYHTGLSDFKVTYSLPVGYQFVSTAEKDAGSFVNEGTVKVKNVREFFGAAVKDMEVYETKVGGVEIRLYSKDDHDKDLPDTLDLAKKAVAFYSSQIDDFPYAQLDIMLEQCQFMEYPGIMTVDPYTADQHFYEMAIVHEIAHQYFYSTVMNDPYHEAWLDEGFTELAASLYYFAEERQSEDEAFALSEQRMNAIEQDGLGRQYSNVSLKILKDSGFVYGQPALEIFKMIQEKNSHTEKDLRIVSMEFLSAYYERFKYKEVSTKEFITFAKEYFSVPADYFNSWLDTSEEAGP